MCSLIALNLKKCKHEYNRFSLQKLEIPSSREKSTRRQSSVMTLWLGVKDFEVHVAGRIFGRLLAGLAEDEALKGSAFTFVAPLTVLLLSVAASECLVLPRT